MRHRRSKQNSFLLNLENEKEILIFLLGRFEIFGIANYYLTTFQSVFVEQNMNFSTPTQNFYQIGKHE